MEIDVTDFFNTADPSEYSASRAERGFNAGKITWAAAMARAAERPRNRMLNTPEQLEAFAGHMAGFGAWSDEEIDAWTVNEANALFIQLVSGDMREAGMDDPATFDWDEYEKNCAAGRVNGNFFKGDDGRVYYTLD
jgi:hypothetical protein